MSITKRTGKNPSITTSALTWVARTSFMCSSCRDMYLGDCVMLHRYVFICNTRRSKPVGRLAITRGVNFAIYSIYTHVRNSNSWAVQSPADEV